MTETGSAAPKSGYDLSLLSGGFLFNSKLNGYLVGLLSSVISVAIITLYTAMPQLALVLACTMVALVIVLVVVFVWKAWMLEPRYNQAVDAFAAAHNFVPLTPENLLFLVPLSLQVPMAYNKTARGFLLGTATGKIAVFDYAYTVGSGKQRQDYHFAISVIALDKQYPHLYLDGKANGTNYTYAESQKVALEGDFNNYFTLYIPAESAAGALTVFAPDMMRTLIDQGRQFDVEVEGNHVALMTPGRAFTKESFGPLLSGTQAVAKEFAQLDVSWQPVYNNTGQSFALKKRKFTLATVLLIVFVILYYLLQFVSSMLR